MAPRSSAREFANDHLISATSRMHGHYRAMPYPSAGNAEVSEALAHISADLQIEFRIGQVIINAHLFFVNDDVPRIA